MTYADKLRQRSEEFFSRDAIRERLQDKADIEAGARARLEGDFNQKAGLRREIEGTFGQKEAGEDRRLGRTLQGNLDVQGLSNRGAFDRTQMTEQGAMARAQLNEGGAMDRAKLLESGAMARTQLGDTTMRRGQDMGFATSGLDRAERGIGASGIQLSHDHDLRQGR